MNNMVVEDTKDREMTNEEYRDMIIEMINSIDNKKLLNLIHNIIKSAIKKWL